jgi:hypothetical protein
VSCPISESSETLPITVELNGHTVWGHKPAGRFVCVVIPDERGPLSLVRTIVELLERKVAAPV